jgi:tRNA threonylcarbamoyladenosine biosynthesis protein TsaB
MLLALDTATATASLALYDLAGEQLLAETTWFARRRHTQDLLVAAQRLLHQAGSKPTALTALAVTTGPGSFTGVRIAISAVKGMALGLPEPCVVVGLPTLCVTAAPWLALAAHSSVMPVVCAYLQAGRGRYNWVFFDLHAPLWQPAADDHHAGTADELVAALTGLTPQPVWLVGEVEPSVTQAASACHHVVVIDGVSGWRRAGHLAGLAVRLLAQGRRDDLRTLQPLYLRTP